MNFEEDLPDTDPEDEDYAPSTDEEEEYEHEQNETSSDEDDDADIPYVPLVATESLTDARHPQEPSLEEDEVLMAPGDSPEQGDCDSGQGEVDYNWSGGQDQGSQATDTGSRQLVQQKKADETFQYALGTERENQLQYVLEDGPLESRESHANPKLDSMVDSGGCRQLTQPFKSQEQTDTYTTQYKELGWLETEVPCNQKDKLGEQCKVCKVQPESLDLNRAGGQNEDKLEGDHLKTQTQPLHANENAATDGLCQQAVAMPIGAYVEPDITSQLDQQGISANGEDMKAGNSQSEDTNEPDNRSQNNPLNKFNQHGQAELNQEKASNDEKTETLWSVLVKVIGDNLQARSRHTSPDSCELLQLQNLSNSQPPTDSHTSGCCSSIESSYVAEHTVKPGVSESVGTILGEGSTAETADAESSYSITGSPLISTTFNGNEQQTENLTMSQETVEVVAEKAKYQLATDDGCTPWLVNDEYCKHLSVTEKDCTTQCGIDEGCKPSVSLEESCTPQHITDEASTPQLNESIYVDAKQCYLQDEPDETGKDAMLECFSSNQGLNTESKSDEEILETAIEATESAVNTDEEKPGTDNSAILQTRVDVQNEDEIVIESDNSDYEDTIGPEIDVSPDDCNSGYGNNTIKQDTRFYNKMYMGLYVIEETSEDGTTVFEEKSETGKSFVNKYEELETQSEFVLEESDNNRQEERFKPMQIGFEEDSIETWRCNKIADESGKEDSGEESDVSDNDKSSDDENIKRLDVKNCITNKNEDNTKQCSLTVKDTYSPNEDPSVKEEQTKHDNCDNDSKPQQTVTAKSEALSTFADQHCMEDIHEDEGCKDLRMLDDDDIDRDYVIVSWEEVHGLTLNVIENYRKRKAELEHDCLVENGCKILKPDESNSEYEDCKGKLHVRGDLYESSKNKDNIARQKITTEYDYYGDFIKMSVEIDVDSKEARQILGKDEPSVAQDNDSSPSGLLRNLGRILKRAGGSMLGMICKRPKLSMENTASPSISNSTRVLEEETNTK